MMPVVSNLESSIARAAASFWRLAESLREISDIKRLPALVLPGATREIYAASFAPETIRPWDERDEKDAETEIQLFAEAERETSGCIALLQQVASRLALQYIGARDALYGNNTDRARLILSSLGNCGTLFLGDCRQMIASAHVFRVRLIRRSTICGQANSSN